MAGPLVETRLNFSERKTRNLTRCGRYRADIAVAGAGGGERRGVVADVGLVERVAVGQSARLGGFALEVADHLGVFGSAVLALCCAAATPDANARPIESANAAAMMRMTVIGNPCPLDPYPLDAPSRQKVQIWLTTFTWQP